MTWNISIIFHNYPYYPNLHSSSFIDIDLEKSAIYKWFPTITPWIFVVFLCFSSQPPRKISGIFRQGTSPPVRGHRVMPGAASRWDLNLVLELTIRLYVFLRKDPDISATYIYIHVCYITTYIYIRMLYNYIYIYVNYIFITIYIYNYIYMTIYI
jgi:hypothetical protein